MKTEIVRKLIELEIKNLIYAIETSNKIIPVIEKFEGKQPNKRLDTALKQIDKSLYFETRYNSFIISLYLADRHVPNGDHSVSYVIDHSKNLIHASLKSSYNDGACQDGVIRSDILKDHLLSYIDYANKTIERLEIEAANLDTIIIQYEAIKTTISNFQDNFTHITREYLDLKF